MCLQVTLGLHATRNTIRTTPAAGSATRVRNVIHRFCHRDAYVLRDTPAMEPFVFLLILVTHHCTVAATLSPNASKFVMLYYNIV